MSKTVVITRLLVSLALTFTVAVGTAGVAQAASPKASSASSQMKPPAGWAELKAKLDANRSLHKAVTVSGNTRTITYSSQDGTAMVLEEPVPGTPSNAIQPMLSVGVCFWFQECVYLNHHELVIGASGGAPVLAAVICAASAGTLCYIAIGVAGAAIAAVTEYGICPNTFRIEVWPVPLAPWSEGCW